MKLTQANLSAISALKNVKTPQYLPEQIKQGIVHIGVGGFHRAHLALYIEKLLNNNQAKEWGICGVGLRQQDALMQSVLSEQQHLYTLVELEESDDTDIQVIGSIREFILATKDRQRLIDKLVDPQTKIVSLTITEGGYAIDDSTGLLNPDLPEIRQDLNNADEPTTVFGYLTLALKKRRELGYKAFTVMSCDNLPHNGDVTRNVLLAFSRLLDEKLSDWIAEHVCFPNSMVDRITPATSREHREYLQAQTGIVDQWPVVCEPFIQWVLEDKFSDGRPPFEQVGVEFTQDVSPYEAMKIGLLNGSHLVLTFVGLLHHYDFAHQSMQNQAIRTFVNQFMDLDVTARLEKIAGVDFEHYKQTLIQRFSNVEICDQLLRIASDASSKYPKFIMPTLLWLIEHNKPLDRVALMTAAWIKCLQEAHKAQPAFSAIDDPNDKILQKAIADNKNVTANFLAIEEVFGTCIAKNQHFSFLLEKYYQCISQRGISSALQEVLEQA